MWITMVFLMAGLLFVTEVLLGSSTCMFDSEIHLSHACDDRKLIPHGEFAVKMLPMALSALGLLPWVLASFLVNV